MIEELNRHYPESQDAEILLMVPAERMEEIRGLGLPANIRLLPSGQTLSSYDKKFGGRKIPPARQQNKGPRGRWSEHK